MNRYTLANGTEIQTVEPIADVAKGTAAECDKAEDYADNEGGWNEYIDPSATTPFDSISRDERVALALSVIVSNR